jgi:hypothetical protein
MTDAASMFAGHGMPCPYGGKSKRQRRGQGNISPGADDAPSEEMPTTRKALVVATFHLPSAPLGLAVVGAVGAGADAPADGGRNGANLGGGGIGTLPSKANV